MPICGCSTSTRRWSIRTLGWSRRTSGGAGPSGSSSWSNALGEALAAGRYFDVVVEYAKADQDDILCRITAYNRGPEPAELHILPQAWYRNTWSWGFGTERPALWSEAATTIRTTHRHLGDRWWYLEGRPHAPALLFTENETNRWRLFGVPNAGPYVKDAFHEAVVHGKSDWVNPAGRGSKAAGHYRAVIEPGGSMTVRTRLTSAPREDPFGPFDAIVAERLAEADAFYRAIQPPGLDDDRRHGPASGVCRALVVQAVLPLQRGALARRRPRRPRAAGEPAPGPQRRMAARLQPGRPERARQVGISLVRRLGHGVSLHRAGAARPRVGQAADRAAVARVVHASQRPAPGLRVGLRRRQPAGARARGPAGLPDRPRDDRSRGHRLPRGGLPQAALELHLVGQPQGPRGPQRVPGRVPGAGQHRRLRPQPSQPARRPSARAGRRHGVDGAVLPGHAGDRAGAVADPAGV